MRPWAIAALALGAVMIGPVRDSEGAADAGNLPQDVDEPVVSVGGTVQVTGLAFTPDGSRLFILDQFGGRILVYKPQGGLQSIPFATLSPFNPSSSAKGLNRGGR